MSAKILSTNLEPLTANASIRRSTREDCPRARQTMMVVVMMAPWHRWRRFISVPVPRHVGHTVFLLPRIKVSVKVDFEIRLIHEVLLFGIFLVLLIF
jgi:hypothetical protein